MAKLTPDQFADKHARRLKASVEDIKAGIDRVSTSPGELAVAKQEKLVQRWTEAVSSGKWADNTRSVSLADWKQKTKDKGTQRIAGGIDAAREKVVKFAGDLLAYQDSVLPQIRNMPDITLEDGIARSRAMIEAMSKFRKGRRG